eukprot:gene26419-35068_t
MDEYDYRQQIMNSNTLLKPMIKSQYRGVYRCGKKWKAQMQSNGVQFYLGIYETEIEAAQAYERKVKESGGGNPRLKSAPGGRRYDGGSIHFEGKSEGGNIDLAQVFMLQHQQHRSYHNNVSPSQSMVAKESGDEPAAQAATAVVLDPILDTMTAKPLSIPDRISTQLKTSNEKVNPLGTNHHITSSAAIQPSEKTNTEFQRAEETATTTTTTTTTTNPIDSSSGPLLRLMWERFCQISQRIIVAKSSQQLLKQLSDGDPSDPEKKQLLAALDEEVGMLVTVKGQLEEAVSRCFARDITMKATVVSVVPPANIQPTTRHVLLVDAKIQTLKRKAPEQLLVYRNRIGPVGKKGPAAVQPSRSNTTVEEEDEEEEEEEDNDRGEGRRRGRRLNKGEDQDALTSAATTGLISLSTRHPQLLPQADDVDDHHDAAMIDSSASSSSSTRGNEGGCWRDSGIPRSSSSLQQQPKARKSWRLFDDFNTTRNGNTPQKQTKAESEAEPKPSLHCMSSSTLSHTRSRPSLHRLLFEAEQWKKRSLNSISGLPIGRADISIADSTELLVSFIDDHVGLLLASYMFMDSSVAVSCAVSKNDSGSFEYPRKVVEGWFLDTPLIELKRGNLLSWTAWAFFDEEISNLSPEEQKENNLIGYSKLRGFVDDDKSQNFYFRPAKPSVSSTKLPIVFVHGIGVGFAAYLNGVGGP